MHGDIGTSAPIWNRCSDLVPSATTNSSIKFEGLLSAANKRHRDTYGTAEHSVLGSVAKDRIFSPTVPGCSGLHDRDVPPALYSLPEKQEGLRRSLWQPDAHTRGNGVLRSDNSHQPKWVSSRVISSDRLVQEFYRLTEQGHLKRALDILSLMGTDGSAHLVQMYKSLLKACGEKKVLTHAKLVHAHLVGLGMETRTSLGEYLVSVLVKCRGLEDAITVFEKLPHRTVFSWTSLISGYVACGKNENALKMYHTMLDEGVQPNSYTFVSALRACGTIGDLEEGRRIHADIVKNSGESDLFVCTSLVEMYGRCGSLLDAQKVFHNLAHPDALAWNAMFVAHVLHGRAKDVLHLYEQMQEEGVAVDSRTAVSIIQACGMLAQQGEDCVLNGRRIKLESLKLGKEVHASVRWKRYDSDVIVGSTLISMYSACGSIADARIVFDELSLRDVVAWNTMLSAYLEQAQPEQASQLYDKMLGDGVSASDRTFVSMLQVCGMFAEKEEAILVRGQPMKVKTWVQGKEVHAQAHERGYASDVYVGSALINMYQKCGDIMGALNVFRGLSQLNVVSCNSMLRAFVEHSCWKEALLLYEQMNEECVHPDHRTSVIILQACCMLAMMEEDSSMDGRCIKANLLHRARAMHANSRMKDYDLDVCVGNVLISTYGKCGSLVDAQIMFDGLPERDVVSWNGMLVAYLQQGQGDMALQLYEQMQATGVSPNDRTFVSTLQACGILAQEEEAVFVEGKLIKVRSLGRVQLVYAGARRKGYESNIFVVSTLISMFGCCGSLQNAEEVFHQLPGRDVLTLNALLAVYVDFHQGEEALVLHEQMVEEGVSWDYRTFVILLQACGMVAEKQAAVLMDAQFIKPSPLTQGKALHAELQRKGLDSDVFIASTLISLYRKSGSILDAQCAFERLQERDVVLWNAMLVTYVDHGQPEKALQLYADMCDTEVSPSTPTFLSLVQALCRLADKEEGVLVDGQLTKMTCLQLGQAVHAEIARRGYGSDSFVTSALISMYSKCGSITDALNVFGGSPELDVVSQTAMLEAYVDNGQVVKALEIYEQIWEQGLNANRSTIVSILRGCCTLASEEENVLMDGNSIKSKSLQTSKSIHAAVLQNGFSSDVFIISSLVSVYGKCGSIVDAQTVFAESPGRDVVAWTAMLAAYVQQGDAEGALQQYMLMHKDGVSPNERTFATVLQACGMFALMEEDIIIDVPPRRAIALEKGKGLHAIARSRGYMANTVVASKVIIMYGNCRAITDACHVFNEFLMPDVTLCNAILVVYVEHGLLEKALQLYRKMEQEGPGPNEVTYIWILRAVGKMGNLSMVRQIHHNFVQLGNGLTSLMKCSLIYAYGRCAGVGDAQAAFHALPKPDLWTWNALLSCYAHQGDCAASLRCFESMQGAGVKPDGVTFLSLLCACSHAGSVQEGLQYFDSMTIEYNVNPELDHYVTMVNLLGRAGCFTQVGNLIATMPMQPDLAIWLSLLAACRKHGQVNLGEEAFHSAVCRDSKHPSAYMLMASIYGDAGRFADANRVMELRGEQGAWKQPGQSWMNQDNTMYTFTVRDVVNLSSELHSMLKNATLSMTDVKILPTGRLTSSISTKSFRHINARHAQYSETKRYDI